MYRKSNRTKIIPDLFHCKEADVLKYTIRRLALLPLIMFLVSSILFILFLQLPVEQRVAVYIPSHTRNMTPEEYAVFVQTLIGKYGLDQPLPVQYAKWLGGLATGNWGFSPSAKQPVLEGIVQRLPATLELVLYSMIPAVLLALGLGTVAARNTNRLPDHMIRAASFIAWAFPPFILAFMLLIVFYVWLGWFPPGRMSYWVSSVLYSGDFHSFTGMLTIDALLNGNIRLFFDAIRHLVLPSFVLALTVWALLTRVMRSSLLEALSRDYITMARAKGVPEQRIFGHHARRNALLPVISIGGVVVSLLITGTVIVEVIFNFNGVGRWAVKAIILSDIPVAMGFTLFSAMVTVLASFFADILYAVIDPRVQLY